MLEFKIDDIYQAGQISQELEQAAGKGFMATNWMEQNKALFRALRLERLVTFITIGLIVFVAALNILISLTMMVMEKTRDIAVLMSMGTRKSQVRRLFIAQGLLIGVIGTVIGLALGYALSWAGGHYHLLSLAPEVYSIDYVPFAPRAIDGALVALVAIGISLVATLYPSWSAARILPLKRYAMSNLQLLTLIGIEAMNPLPGSLPGSRCDHGHIVFASIRHKVLHGCSRDGGRRCSGAGSCFNEDCSKQQMQQRDG